MARNSSSDKPDGIGEIVKTIVYALLIALVFRVFLFQPFSIPSSSMKPTLLIGDYLFVSKYAYGYSKNSIPFSPPLFEGRIWFTPPERGDVIVFKNKLDDNKDYIKRLIGLPGDKIQVQSGIVFINGTRVQVEAIDPFIELVDPNHSQQCAIRQKRDGKAVCVKEQFVEILPNDVTHLTLNVDSNSRGRDNTKVFEVPEGHYFFMGDNRDNSGDSRLYGGHYIPEEDLIGRAEIIFLSSEGSPFFPWQWRFERIFNAIN